jgi:hypothetical protein
MFRRPTKGLLNPTLCKRWAVVCLIHRRRPRFIGACSNLVGKCARVREVLLPGGSEGWDESFC